MKPSYVLPLAAIASAFVIPDAETAQSLQLQLQDSRQATSLWDNLPDWNTLWHEIDQKTTKAVGCAKQKLTNALDLAYDTAVKYDEQFQTAFAGEAWLEYFEDEDDSSEFDEALDEGPPHHGPPPPHHERPPPPPPPHERPPHDGPPHRRPHHPPRHGPPHRKRPHHGPPNRTVYELIAESKYTTKLAKAINEFPDLVELLNGTAANYTVFAPTDKAFEKIPKHAPKPSKEQLKKLLTYHVSSEFYPAGRVLVTRTIPSALDAEYIKDVPQRLSTQISLRGLTVNFYSRIIAANIFGTNGVIHGVDSILLPPPKVIDILTALPGEFSTLELALWKTGLFEQFNDTSSHDGGTIFAPNNWAFKKLGPRANAFLFSEHGLKYLKALILYHVVGDITLYSDAIYKSKSEESLGGDHRIPKGVYHIDLPTALEGKKLSVDVARYGRLIEIKINAFNRVAVTDGIAADGVIQVVNNLLIPPKEPHAAPIIADESLTVEELKAALAPYVEQDAADDYDWEL